MEFTALSRSLLRYLRRRVSLRMPSLSILKRSDRERIVANAKDWLSPDAIITKPRHMGDSISLSIGLGSTNTQESW